MGSCIMSVKISIKYSPNNGHNVVDWVMCGQTVHDDNYHNVKVTINIIINNSVLPNITEPLSKHYPVFIGETADIITHELTHVRECVCTPYMDKLSKLLNDSGHLYRGISAVVDLDEICAYAMGIEANRILSRTSFTNAGNRMIDRFFTDCDLETRKQTIASLRLFKRHYLKEIEAPMINKILI